MTAGRVDQPSVPGALRNHEGRLRSLEAMPERWVYVGTVGVDGIDALITPDSPPFQNGWSQAGGGEQYLSFVLRPNGWVYVRGVPTGGADNTVVFTLPVNYRPPSTAHFTSAGRFPGSAITWRIETSGDVIYETQIGGGGSGFIQFDLDNVGTWFELETTGSGPTGHGIDINDNGGHGLYLLSVGGTIELDADNIGIFPLSGGLNVFSSGGIFLQNDTASYINIEDTGPGGITITTQFGSAGIQIHSGQEISVTADGAAGISMSASGAGGGISMVTDGGIFASETSATFGFDIVANGGAIRISEAGGGDIIIAIKTGAQVKVLDHSSNPIFEVRENGDLHGKTGHALVFDL